MNWKVLLSPPEVSDVERELLMAAFDSGWVAPAGPDLDQFELELADFTGAGSAVGLSSGTAALHLALMAAGVSSGADVLVSDLTFGASAFAVTYLGARPCFVDCEAATWHMDPELLEEELRRRARIGGLPAAVVVADLYGSVADYQRLQPICDEYDVPLIEDAAEAIGASRQGRPAGRFGQIAVLSFNGNKIVTTGGGGAVLTDDAAVAARVRYLATQARQPVLHYEHHDIGYNYRMGNLNAAVGRGQLRTLPLRIQQRRRVRDSYERLLGSLPGIGFQSIPTDCVPNHWLTTVTIDGSQFGASAGSVLAALHAARFEARPGFKPMHLQPVFSTAQAVGGAASTEFFANSISLPSSGRISDNDLAEICEVIASCGAG